MSSESQRCGFHDQVFVKKFDSIRFDSQKSFAFSFSFSRVNSKSNIAEMFPSSTVRMSHRQEAEKLQKVLEESQRDSIDVWSVIQGENLSKR